MIAAVGVTKAFDGRPAIEDVSFAVREGEFVAVLGPSGAGKTTLFRCMTGLLAPDRGTVRVGDALPPERFVLESLRAGYRRVDSVAAPGEISRRGGIVDVFPPEADEPVRIELVAEVAFEHMQGDRFRHTARFQRWRPDCEPSSCTYAQLDVPVPIELHEVFGV